MAVVEGEEEDGEEDGDVLVGGAAVGGAQQLEAGHRDHQGADPGDTQSSSRAERLSRPDDKTLNQSEQDEDAAHVF